MSPTKDQNGRAAKMKAYVESALDNPQVVGVHGHQFSDQAPSSIRAVRGLDGEAWLS